jgi:hypothetical protein
MALGLEYGLLRNLIANGSAIASTLHDCPPTGYAAAEWPALIANTTTMRLKGVTVKEAC